MKNQHKQPDDIEEAPTADLRPEEVRLKDGSKAYRVFLPDTGDGFDDPQDIQDAKDSLRQAIKENPDAVLEWQGKTRDEIRSALGLDFDLAA